MLIIDENVRPDIELLLTILEQKKESIKFAESLNDEITDYKSIVT